MESNILVIVAAVAGLIMLLRLVARTARGARPGHSKAEGASLRRSDSQERHFALQPHVGNAGHERRSDSSGAQYRRKTAGIVAVASTIMKVHDSVKEGESIVHPLEASSIFPPMVISMELEVSVKDPAAAGNAFEDRRGV